MKCLKKNPIKVIKDIRIVSATGSTNSDSFEIVYESFNVFYLRVLQQGELNKIENWKVIEKNLQVKETTFLSNHVC